MDILQSILLGAVQGLAEFLPISSSGHLLVAQKLLGLQEVPLLFDVLLHLPTLLAICIIFRKRLGQIFTSIFRLLARKNNPADSDNLKLTLMIIIATVFTVAIGLVIKLVMDAFQARTGEDIFVMYPWSVGIMFLITAGILIASRYFKSTKGYDKITIRDGIVTGIAQGIGVLPGISRSGITVSGALLVGLEREKAGEFAFLVSIPAIIGASILEIKDAAAMQITPVVLVAGLVSAFVVGFFSLLLLLRLIKSGKFYLFSFYLIPVGLFTIIYFLINK